MSFDLEKSPPPSTIVTNIDGSVEALNEKNKKINTNYPIYYECVYEIEWNVVI